MLLAIFAGHAQPSNEKTFTATVYGNCGMCQGTIEKAGTKAGQYKTGWNKDTKQATIQYNAKRTTGDAVLKQIALAGYDNDKFLAPDESYNKLPACCKYERVKKHAVVNTQPVTGNAASAQGHITGMDNLQQDSSQLKPVFEGYFALKDALVKTDGNAAAARAKDLQTAINAVKMEKLSMEVHMSWMKVLAGLKEDASHIAANAANPAHQREHFAELSLNMYELVKVAKPAGTIYYQHCPMYNDGKGANWLSKESGIKNPYYGSQMLTCGKTVEIIKQ